MLKLSYFWINFKWGVFIREIIYSNSLRNEATGFHKTFISVGEFNTGKIKELIKIKEYNQMRWK